MPAGAATLGAPDDGDEWDEDKSSPLVDTLVEAVVVAVIAVLANITLHILCSLSAPPHAVR